LHAYWYWRGVRAAGATLAELERMRQDTSLVPEAAREIELDLACDLPNMAALLAAARAHAARLRFHQVPIGFVGPQAGAEPPSPCARSTSAWP
jgi:hypothetical protein